MTAADHGSPIPYVDEWVVLADAIQAVIDAELGDCPDNQAGDGGLCHDIAELGDCPDNQAGDGGLCHDIAEVLINSGWSR